MKKDICYLSPLDEAEVPFTLVGECSGYSTLIQKIICLLLTSTKDPVRYYGGNLATLLKGCIREGAAMTNYVDSAVAEVSDLLRTEQGLNLHNLPLEEQLDTLYTKDITIVDKTTVNIELSVTTKAGTAYKTGFRLETNK